MIEEVVNSILEAEDVAKRRIAEAEAKAAEIEAEAEVSALKKQQAAFAKRDFAEQIKKAEELADDKAAKRLAELNGEADRQTADYAKNIDKAVKIIIEAN